MTFDLRRIPLPLRHLVHILFFLPNQINASVRAARLFAAANIYLRCKAALLPRGPQTVIAYRSKGFLQLCFLSSPTGQRLLESPITDNRYSIPNIYSVHRASRLSPIVTFPHNRSELIPRRVVGGRKKKQERGNSVFKYKLKAYCKQNMPYNPYYTYSRVTITRRATTRCNVIYNAAVG